MSEIKTHGFVETWDTLLKHFCSRDDLRPAMCKPNISGEFVYATDAHSWIKVPYIPAFRTYGRHDATPNFDAVSSKFEFIPAIYISKDSISSVLSKCSKEPDWKECKSCKGNGGTNCKCCDTYLECDICKG